MDSLSEIIKKNTPVPDSNLGLFFPSVFGHSGLFEPESRMEVKAAL